ncbi:MAG: phosphate signaling complex protein PhoU [Gammaproteobacteria bacterium]|nr:phosphate signaling complex protein PhoU [Gammaproteobacteria bacterium]
MTVRRILESNEQALKNDLDEMYSLVSLALDRALQSLLENNVDTAAQVITEDSLINQLQHKIENKCIRTIALQQPVASDLRKLMSDIFISMELERIADHAAAIARIVLKFETPPDARHVQPVSEMGDKCKTMLNAVMQAYDETDESLARNAACMDDEIDSAEQEFDDFMLREISGEVDHKIVYTYLLWIAHNLERIGDRATNIAERVAYITTNETPELNR